ncbi:SDR family NAD(P)-dependent oxidoreductase [Parafrankia sp. FMc2]|uniref:SDR family NAD(P)-dependent oxidoreductase n=1 Tax=Parafrankia sp. FMc2 TaxID=3233196 RepID=UPI0034D4912B
MSGSGPRPSETELVAWLVAQVADAAELDPADVDPDQPLNEVGLASRDAVALTGEIEEYLDVVLPATLVWENPTIRLLARALTGTGDTQALPPADGPTTGTRPPALVQHGMLAEHGAPAEIAVVGVGCRFPSGDGPEEFWAALTAGQAGVGEVPPQRWAPFAARAPEQAELLARTTRWGGFLADVEGFDAEFFGITPREAELMDPQQRLLLEVVWEALEHAAIRPSSLRGTRTGVFVGLSVAEYAYLTTADLTAIDAWTSTGSAPSIAAGRISYLLDLRGPSIAVDTACSSSLVAVHQASQSLRAGEIDLAIVGGVNLLLTPAVTVNFDLGGALAADGRCKTFSAGADGIARGEGCGVVVLERSADARQARRPALAVIRGSAVNSDGRSNGLTAPSPQAQADLLRTAYAAARIASDQVDYVEAHGTGTPLGDPIEASALGEVLGAGRPPDRPLLTGSVKTNLGHLEAAAGIAGLIKVVLGLHHGQIPPSLNFTAPNPFIDFAAARLRVVTGPAPQPWPRYGGRATAGVSAFGFSGTNAHVVLTEAGPADGAHHGTGPAGVLGDLPAVPTAGPVLTVSGLTADRARAAAGDLADWLAATAHAQAADSAMRLAEAAGILAHHRDHGPAAFAVIGRDLDGVVAGLRTVAAGGDRSGRPDVVVAAGRTGGRNRERAEAARGPLFVFSGYGSQWRGMGARLLAEDVTFARIVAAVDVLTRQQAGFSVRAALGSTAAIEGVAATQLTLFTMQVALAGTLRSYGVVPGAVLGHSMGEVAAAVVAGALDLADGVRVMAVRSRLLESVETTGTGAMAMVGLSAAELTKITAEGDAHPGVGVAVYSSPTQCVVAGDPAGVAALVEHAGALGRDAWALDVRGAAHSPAVDPVLAELTAALADVRGRAPRIPLYGTALTDPRSVPAFDAEYWAANARRPVRFTQALAAAAEDGFTTVAEIAPHPVAAASIRETLRAGGVQEPAPVVLGRRDTDDHLALRAAVAQLDLHGVNVDRHRLVPLVRPRAATPAAAPPRTRWHRRRHWFTPPLPAGRAPARGAGVLPPAGQHPFLGQRVELPEGGRHLWRTVTGTDQLPWLGDHRLRGAAVMPGAGFAETVLAATAEAFGVDPAQVSVHDLELLGLLSVEGRVELTTSVTITGRLAAVVDVHARVAGPGPGPATGAGAGPGTPLPWEKHATARVTVGDPLEWDDDWDPLVDAVEVDVPRLFAEVGHAYGPAFTGVDAARSGASADQDGGWATARVGLGPAAPTDGTFVVHPALLDLCLQVFAAAGRSLPAGPGEDARRWYVPVGVGSLRVLADPGRGGHCRGRLRRVDADRLRGTVQLLGADGEVRLEARDVDLRALPDSAVPVPLARRLYETRWDPAPLPVEPARPAPATWLVVDAVSGGGSGVDDRLAVEVGEGLRAAGHRVTAVRGVGRVADVLERPADDPDRTGTGLVLVCPSAVPLEADVVPADPVPADAVPVEATAAAAADLVFAVAEMVRAATAGPRGPIRLWVVTQGAAALDGPGDPAGGCLRGIVRVLAFEHPELAVTVVDADVSAGETVVAELLAGTADDEVAWRGDTRLVGRLHTAGDAVRAAGPRDAVSSGDAAGMVVRPGSYVVTGGLSGLGLSLARWLGDRGARRVVLNGRSDPSTAADAELDDLRRAGTDVVVVTGDIAETTVARRLVEAAVAGGVPLYGVAHAAGVLDDAVVLGLERAGLDRVWRPKVHGALRLHAATRGIDLDWLLLFSSAAALFGSPGQGAYAAANAWLDAFARQRRADGLPATSIEWGAWSGIGGARDNDNVLLAPISPAEGFEALEAVLVTDRPVTGVTGLNVAAAVELFPALATLPFFAELAGPGRTTGAGTGPSADTGGGRTSGGDWMGVPALLALPADQARAAATGRTRARLASIMGFGVEDVDPDVPLTQLGLDSLMAMRAKNAVEADFGVALPARMLLQGASLNDFEHHVACELGLSKASPVASRGPSRVGPRDATERWLAVLWREALTRETREGAIGRDGAIGVTDSFHALGGDEAAATRLVEAVQAHLDERSTAGVGVGGQADSLAGWPRVSATELFAEPTVAAMADLLRDRFEGDTGSPVRFLRPLGDGAPLFLFHPAGGTSSVYHPLVSQLPDRLGCVGFERLDEIRTVEQKAARYVELLREFQPTGPYRLAGWSFGGVLAYEAAVQLVDAGETVDLVAMIDSIQPLPVPAPAPGRSAHDLVSARLTRFVSYLEQTYDTRLDVAVDALAGMPEDEQVDLLTRAIADAGLGMSPGVLAHQRTSYLDARIAERYQPRRYAGPVILYRAERPEAVMTALDERYHRTDLALGWDECCDDLEVLVVPGDHLSLVDRPDVDAVARHLAARLARRPAATSHTAAAASADTASAAAASSLAGAASETTTSTPGVDR